MTSLLDGYNQGFRMSSKDEDISDDVVLGTWAHMELTMHPNFDSTSTLYTEHILGLPSSSL